MQEIDPIETLSLAQLRDQVELPLLAPQLRSAAAKSPFWRRWFDRAGYDACAPRAIKDFHRLPFSDKKDVLADQLENPPFGTLPAVAMDQVTRVHRTSGSTNRPLIVLLTGEDVENTLSTGARALRCAGVRADDLVVHCLNYCMWSGGVTDHLCLERAGAAVIPFGVGNTKYLIQTILNLKPTAISCTPSYFGRLEEVLRAEFGLSPDRLGLKKAFFGGEAGLQQPAFREAIESRWRLQAIDANYGLSDVLSIMASECAYRTGLHFHAQGVLMVELIDAQENAVPIEKGATGEMVLTTLVRRAQPLFRYRTHDVVQIVDTDSCACGRRGFVFKVIGRSDDMLIVKGINFFPNALQGTLGRFRDVLSGEYRVVLPKPPFDRVPIRIELAGTGDGEDQGRLREAIASQIRSEHSISVAIEFVPAGTYEKSENKTSRLVRE